MTCYLKKMPYTPRGYADKTATPEFPIYKTAPVHRSKKVLVHGKKDICRRKYRYMVRKTYVKESAGTWQERNMPKKVLIRDKKAGKVLQVYIPEDRKLNRRVKKRSII